MIPFLPKCVTIQPVFFKMVELKKQIFPPEKSQGDISSWESGKHAQERRPHVRDCEDPPVCPLIRPQNNGLISYRGVAPHWGF